MFEIFVNVPIHNYTVHLNYTTCSIILFIYFLKIISVNKHI